MKKAAMLIILAAFSLGLSGCDDSPPQPSEITAVPSIVCYEDFPGVPDYGALCGYEQYSKTQYEALTIYSYEAKEPGQIGASIFEDNYSAYENAAAALGYETDGLYWPDEHICRVSCGGELVYICRTTGEYNDELLSLIIVAVGTAEAFAAYEGN